MIIATPGHDRRLRARLEGLARKDRDYWSFKGNCARENGHGLFQYPAMMVPQVARAVLEQACEVHPEIECVGDPFAGSGTILTESLARGLSFCGTDINPLAILLCRVKTGPFFVDALEEKASTLLARIDADTATRIEVDFPNRDKWFRADVQVALSRIRRAIVREESSWARRFFWVGMAEAVRLCGNTRTSTFKLHIREAEDIATRRFDAVGVFKKAVERNLKHMADQETCLQEEGLLNRGHYRKAVSLALGDTRRQSHRALADIILTSPPYGDNASTVPYGQYSYLPLQWIELGDIDPRATVEHLRSTHEIDACSLGGSRRIKTDDRDRLIERSPTFKRCLARLRDEPSDRANRVTAFFRDLDDCLESILKGLRPSGLMVWTLGNRRVGGQRIALDAILAELLAVHRASLLCRLTRRISSKRMALRNSIADTMSTESILVMRKAAA
jgi:site-specific DNA-methyltransferase (cytosine-N4-specific)